MIFDNRLRKLLKLTPAEKPSEGIMNLDSNNFSKTIESTKIPVLVDFWAPWCGPCREMAPVLERLALDYAGKAVFAKVNVDDNPKIANHHNIASIPTFILFEGGHPAERIVGAVKYETLDEALRRRL